MKKIVSLILLFMIAVGCAQAETLSVDLSGLSLDELLSLRAEVNEAIVNAYAAQPAGEYAATREQPAPVGATVRYDGSSYLNPAVTDLTITKVLRGDAAWECIRSWNGCNPRPAAGQEYMLVSVKAVSVASETDAQAEIYDYDFAFISADGREYGYAYAAGVRPELTGVYEGAENEGWLVGLIDEGDEPLLVYLKNADRPVWFDLNSRAAAELPDDMELEPLKRGDTGEAVREMQEILIELGFLDDKADGSFGKNTQNAVIAYQTAMSLEPTGVADEETLYLILTRSAP